MRRTQTVTAVLEGLQARLTTISVQATGKRKSRSAQVHLRGWKNGEELRKRLEHALAAAGVETGSEVLEARSDDAGVMTLAVAIAVAAHAGRVPEARSEGTVFAGRLGTDSTVQAVPGMVAIARAAVRKELRPAGPIRQTTEVAHGGPIVAVLRERLGELLAGLEDPEGAEELAPPAAPDDDTARTLAMMPFADQEKERLALAAAGHHHVRLAERVIDLVMCLPGLMGPPTEREHEQIATIHSVAGLGAPPDRPLRYPHFTASPRAMTGWNGQRSRAQPQPAEPGEISLAHNGVLAIELAHPWSREAVERVIDAASKGYTTDGMPGRVVIAGIGTAGSETESELENRLEVDASARDEEETNPDPEGWTRKLVRQVRAAQYAQDRRYGEGQRNERCQRAGCRS